MPRLNDALVYTVPNGKRPVWAIFPLRGKYPAISKEKGGHGCLDATTDTETITKWWTEYPDANIGIATGSVNGILVIDVDVNHGNEVDGTETLRDLEHELGKLPGTVEVITPNGGRHLYFRYPSGYDIGIHKAEAGDRWPGIDIRGNGGYVAAVPSVIKCTDGKRRTYQWELSSYPNETDLADLPEPWLKWVDDLCGRHQGFKLPDASTVTMGMRNDTLFSYACQLRAGGADLAVILTKLGAYNIRLKDPLPQKELDTIANSAMRYQPNTPSHSTGDQKPKKPPMSLDVLADTLHTLSITVKFNLISRSYEFIGRTPAGRTPTQEDLHVMIHNALAGNYTGASMENIAQYTGMIIREHEYNPVLELFRKSHWDGTDRLPQLYALVGIENDPLSQTLVTKWLYQTVAMLFNNAAAPYGADGCLVLNGPQGTGKTSLFRHLAMRDEWFGEGCCIDDHDKDTSRRVVTRWISELGEVESTLKSDISRLKAFITAPMDAYRLPYGKEDVVGPRHTSLCATCNSDRYLIDTTGNRRWWSVPFKRKVPREELLALDALQLWCQIYQKVEPMTNSERAACYRLTDKEQAQLEERNGTFEKPVKGQDEVSDILGRAEREHLNVKIMSITEFKEQWPALKSYTVQQISIALKRNGVNIARTKRGSEAELPTWHP